MFCIKCGKDASIENLCETCFLEGKKLFDMKEMKLRHCDNCGGIFSGKAVISDIDQFILDQIDTNNRLTKKEAHVRSLADRIEATIKAEGFIRPSKKKVKEQKRLVVYVKKMKCKNCVRLLGGYHEAVIQVRGEKIENIIKAAEKALKSSDVTDIEKLKEGYNIKIIRKSAASRAINTLRREFIVKRSFKLVGDKKGKKLYRSFYLVR